MYDIGLEAMTEIQAILHFMNEDQGMTSQVSGGVVAQQMQSMPGEPPRRDNQGYEQQYDEEESFTENDYAFVKDFINHMGSVERARAILDNYETCADCLDIIPDDGEVIDHLADLMPDEPDLPTGLDHGYLYNQNSQVGGMF